MSKNELHQQLNFYSTGKQSFTFVPRQKSNAQSLTVNRTTGEITLNPPSASLPTAADLSSSTVYGILGLLSLPFSDYIILLTGREPHGRLLGHEIYRATDFRIVRVSPDESISYHPVEAHLIALVQSHFTTGLFWFSYTWDVTRRLQSQWLNQSSDRGKALWEIADDRFFWNKFLQSRFIDITKTNPQQNLSPYILPIMFGTFETRPASLAGHNMIFGLISRRSRHRAGTRYFRRGVDQDGHVANFNETEQLVVIDKPGDSSVRLSFVQIRGSVPLYWAEINTLRYKPELQIMEREDSVDAMALHLKEQMEIYGEQNLVNLVNSKGHEKPIKEAFEKHIARINMPKVKYEYFDFHKECKNMRWDRISQLISSIEDDLNRNGYFVFDSRKPDPAKLQTGVVRTNCMDNLDRTNVAQSAIAKWTLNKQLREVGILRENESIDSYTKFLDDFRNIWADHADYISTAYSGTGALKTDFTRTGKRTRMGLLQDGYNSIMRYLKNNYFDGARQDAFDLVTGAWVPSQGATLAISPYWDNRPLMIRSMPYVVFFSIFMICAGLTLPRSSDYSLFYYFFLWFLILWLAMVFIIAHGISYVSWPRLIPLTDAIYYNGPGYRSGNRGRGFGIKAWDFQSTLPKGASKRSKHAHKTTIGHIEEMEMGNIEKKRSD